MLCILVLHDCFISHESLHGIRRLTAEFWRIDIRENMSGSMRSKDGVIEVIIASRRPATRCRSILSFKSRSSKIAGLIGQQRRLERNRPDSQDWNDVWERRNRMHIRQLNQQPIQH
jgi:hypothetical protein